LLSVSYRDAPRGRALVPLVALPAIASFLGRSALRVLVTLTVVALAAGVMAGPIQATAPGTNGRIAFGSDRFGDTHNIFTMNPDGSDVRQLTFLSADQGAALEGAWSPDGSKLVFEQRNADGSVRQIYTINADGSNQHLLFSELSFRDFGPSFSPDGSRVIFARCRPDFEACAIYAVKADGHGLTAISHFDVKHNVLDGRPKFSPDGSTIAFRSFNRGGVTAAVYLMDPHGSNVRRVTPASLEALEPDWSPDGAEIAVDSNCCNPQISAIWKVHPDGSGLQQLTYPTPEHDFWPSFSPAGDRIAFERDSADFSTDSVVTMNADGTDMTTVQTDAFEPSWGPAE
jgi:Tol biopolymer transport system component